MGSGASKPASAAHGSRGSVVANETSETGCVAPELSFDDAPPGTPLTTEPCQAASDRDEIGSLSDEDLPHSISSLEEGFKDSDYEWMFDEEGDDQQLTEEETRKKLDGLLETFEKLYQDTCEHLKKWREVPMDTTNSKAEELLNSVNTLYLELKDDRQIKQKYRMEYKRKAGELMVKAGLVHVLCDGVVKCLEVMKCDEDDENVFEDSLSLDTMLRILRNFADDNPIVCKAVRKHEKLLKTLVTELDDARTRCIKDSLKDGDDSDGDDGDGDTVLSCLKIIHKVGLEEENVPHLRQIPNIVEVLLELISLDTCLTLRKFYAILTLTAVVTDAEAEKFTTTADMISVLLDCVKTALNSDEHEVIIGQECTTANLTELLKAVKRLSKNTSNSRLLVQENVLLLLKQGLQDCKHQAERKACMESLWWLSFNAENQEDIMKDTELLDLVIKVYRDDSDLCHSAAAGMLFQLREHLQKHPREDYNAVVKQLQKGQKPHQATSGHVMLSYQTANRKVVRMICDFLKKNGIPVWMDIYDMAKGEETTTQSMAEAVERSVVFLMCVSETYKHSPFCRQEAEYAFESRKYVIPIKFHKDYKPDGWLGIIGAGKFFFDFSDTNLYCKNLAELLEKIRKAFSDAAKDCPDRQMLASVAKHDSAETATVSCGTSAIDTSHGGLSSSDLDRIKFWTTDKVEEWLRTFCLKSKTIQSLKGKDIAFLYQMKSEAPEFFYHLLISHLQLKKVSDMADFTFALDGVPSML